MRKLALPFLLIPLVAIGAYGCGDGGDDGCPWLDPDCTPTLTVQVVGEGTVTSDPAGISCPGDCSQKRAEATNVTPTASPTPGWQFDGWSDACTGTGSCAVAINRSRSVTATFSTPPP